MAEQKTNAIRMLDTAGIPYAVHTYSAVDGAIDGVSVAQKVGKPPETVYKTLVTRGKHTCFVFVIPVEKTLNLKAAAKTVGEKALEMVAVSDLLKLTGYVRGGCSPIGMKKPFQTVIDAAAASLDTFLVSGGRIGLQIEISPTALGSLIHAMFAEVCS